ncbi:MAG: DNA primase [Candidatus Omnitrophota bacterium]
MGYQINREILDRIREANDIIEIISGYLTLKKTGRYYKALCPFHSEKTPSFIVTPEKGIFHCFGCGTGGDVITFLMRMESLTFSEAVASLAKKTGIQLEFSREDHPENQFRTRLLQLNYQTASFFHRYLKKGPETETARTYLKERGLQPETIDQFLLGFAPSSLQTEKFLQEEGFTRDEMEKAGLKFYQRITFPIFNLSGECVGFGGRSINGAEPKYLNTAETPAFSKGSTLYGLHLSRRAIQDKGEVILVEGYLDMIKTFQAGFTNAAATLGTALTPNQARLFRRFTERVVLLYDGDTAGKNAAFRNMEVLLTQDLQVEVVLLPEGNDPDSFLDRYGAASLTELLKKRESPVLFYLRMSAGDQIPERGADRIAAARKTLPLLLSIASPLKRSEYLSTLAETLQLNEEALRSEFQKLPKKEKLKEKPGEGMDIAQPVQGIVKAEQLLLALALTRPFLRKALQDGLSEDGFEEPNHKIIFQSLVHHKQGDEEEKVWEKLEENPKTMETLSQSIIQVEQYDDKEAEKVFFDTLHRLITRYREDREVKPLFRQRIKSSDEVDMNAIRNFQELIAKRHLREPNGGTD